MHIKNTSTALPRFGLLITVASVLTACNKQPDSNSQVANPQATTSFPTTQSTASTTIDYAHWTSMTSAPVSVSPVISVLCMPPTSAPTMGPPHSTPAVRMYANDTALAAIRSGDMIRVPENGIIIKEKYANIADRKPVAYAAMIKKSAGYDSLHGDWEYLYHDLLNPANSTRGRIQSCIDCHENSKARDYLFLTHLSSASK